MPKKQKTPEEIVNDKLGNALNMPVQKQEQPAQGETRYAKDELNKKGK